MNLTAACACYRREVDLYYPVFSLFSKCSITFAEVPFLKKHIDLLFAPRSLQNLYAVEAKLYDWRKAFKQAAMNQVGAQRSYIALPGPLATRVYEHHCSLFLRHGLGLISVNGGASILIPATRHSCFSLEHYRTLKDTIRNAGAMQPKLIGVVADGISKRKQTLVLLQTRSH